MSDGSDMMMLSVLLKHDQSKTVGAISEQLRDQGFLDAFPPEGVEIVSWVVMMGLGQVVILRFPVSRLREVNRSIEATAWGGFRTEIYATYDFAQIARDQRAHRPDYAEPAA